MQNNLIQNAHLTFKGNIGIARHDWLRLTPAYSVKLVEDELDKLEKVGVVLDPFSGTGTTGLCAANRGHEVVLLDVNPFLIWLAETKTRNYTKQQLEKAKELLNSVMEAANDLDDKNLWKPRIHNIDKWWEQGKLNALARIKAAIDSNKKNTPESDLLLVAFCNSLIKESNAAFNHQSLSLKESSLRLPLMEDSRESVFGRYFAHATKIIESASEPLKGEVKIIHTDSRGVPSSLSIDTIITSPPYVNRMSYIRELRPYMYWLGYLNEARDAGELDWKAIGGTWGTATSKLNTWIAPRKIPIKKINILTEKIAKTESKNGRLLANYVLKYFYDMWEHFETSFRILNSGGQVIYIVGNSSFYGNVVPAELWYAELMEQVGFREIRIETIRKRNSNKALYEFAVYGKK